MIISPITEYSMEYPYGEEAVVWIRSQQAYYRIMSVSPVYAAVWQPLKSLLDLSGHVVNVLLRSGPELPTPNGLERVAALAGRSVAEVSALMTSGRTFVVEQIRNQGKLRLLKSQFFKDLSGAKTWADCERLVAADQKRAKKLLAEQELPVEQRRLEKSERPVAVDLKRVEKSERSVDVGDRKREKKKALAEKRALTEKKPPTEKKVLTGKKPPVEKPPAEKKPAEKKPAEKKPLAGKKASLPATALVAQETAPVAEEAAAAPMAKRSDLSVSLLPCHMVVLDLPSETDFEFQCPYCMLVLRKSRALPKLLPRIRAHLALHRTAAQVHDGLSERIALFTAYVQGRQGDTVDESVLQWPKRWLPAAAPPPELPGAGLPALPHPVAAPHARDRPVAAPEPIRYTAVLESALPAKRPSRPGFTLVRPGSAAAGRGTAAGPKTLRMVSSPALLSGHADSGLTVRSRSAKPEAGGVNTSPAASPATKQVARDLGSQSENAQLVVQPAGLCTGTS